MSPVTATLRALRGDKVAASIQDLHARERDMAATLLAVADRHSVEQEIFHVARDISRWSTEHVRRLADVGQDWGLALDRDAGIDDHDDTLVARVARKSAELTGRLHEPGLLLLADLREVHAKAASLALDWEVLAQTAQALRDRDLLDVAESCSPQSSRQMAWANSKVKETAAQIMVTG